MPLNHILKNNQNGEFDTMYVLHFLKTTFLTSLLDVLGYRMASGKYSSKLDG